MQCSAAGRSFIEGNEARKYTAYQDERGIWTNGIGHTGTDVYPGQVVEDDQVERWFEADIAPVEAIINSSVKVPLNQAQFDALCSLIYNIGVGAFARSTLLRVLNEGKYDLAHDQFLVWNKVEINGALVVSQGLLNRRMKEAAMFGTGAVPVEVATLPVSNAVPDAPPEQRPTYTSSRTLWLQGTGIFGSLGALISSGAGDLADMFKDAAANISGLIQYSDKLKYVFIALTAIAAILTFAERVRKLRIGR